MRKNLFIALIALSCLAVSVNAATLTVTKTADTNDGVCDSDCSLREAIAVTISGDSIVFASPLFDTQQRITLSSELYVSNKTLTITGRGSLTEISGGDVTRVIRSDGNLTLNDIHLISGRTGQSSANVANGYGGNIFNNGTLTVNRCQILFGTVVGTGNGYGGGIYNAAGRFATINQSYVGFNGLFSQDGYGGGIANDGQLVLMNSVVGSNSGNASRNFGVGIHNSANGTMEIIGSTLYSNTANRTNNLQNLGGGLFNSGVVVLSNSTVSSNSVRLANFNSSTGRGGGIYNNSGAFGLRLTNCTVAENWGENSGSGIWSDSQVMLANTIVSANANPINILIPVNSSVNSSFTTQNGAGLLPLADNGGITPTYALAPSSVARNTGNNCAVTANGCGTSHPALTTDQRGGSYTRQSGSNVDMGAVEYMPVVSNAASSGAGSFAQSIADASSGDTIRFEAAFFNTPRTIALTGGELVIAKNLDIVGPGVSRLTIDAGNASRIFSVQSNSTLTVTGVKLTRGASAGIGGCVFTGGVFNFINGEISNCSGTHGGAIYSTNTINLVGSTVKTNTAQVAGGGIYSDGLFLATDSTVEENSSPSVGGIWNAADRTSTLTRTIVRGNTSSASAGGIYNGGTLNFYYSTLSGNTAQAGGGLVNDGFSNFVNSTVSGNTATDNKGAGIYNGASRVLHLLNTTITVNYAAAFAGAGIWNENFGYPTPTVRARNTIIAGNQADAGNPMDHVGDLTNLGNNIVNSPNPGLAPLGNYGGPTPTHALLQTSPAVDAGDNCVLTANTCGVGHAAYLNDQRNGNTPRLIGANVDIGAFERNISFTPATLPSSIQNYTYNQQVTPTRIYGFAGGNLAPFTYSIISGSLPPGLSLNTSTGAITGSLTQAGAFPFTIKVVDTDGIAGVQAYNIQVFGPTSANVTVSGRVLTKDGHGLRNAIVTLTDANGAVRTARSSSFGNYSFENIETGRTYVIAVNSKRFTFTPRILTVNEELSNIDLIAEGSPDLQR